MALHPPSIVRKVTGLPSGDKEKICDFLHGAVVCWCKIRKTDWFTLHDLVGDERYLWTDTPLRVLWGRHTELSDNPVGPAAKEAGWLLKNVLVDSSLPFEIAARKGDVREYRWIGDSPVGKPTSKPQA
jgi:hypothetical protein